MGGGAGAACLYGYVGVLAETASDEVEERAKVLRLLQWQSFTINPLSVPLVSYFPLLLAESPHAPAGTLFGPGLALPGAPSGSG